MSSQESQDRGFSQHVTITVAPSNIDAFLAALRPCYDAVTAEPECTYLEVFHSLQEPGVFCIVENWTQSPQWFQEHQSTKEYYKPYLEVTEPMWIKPRTFKIFGRLSSREWMTVKEGNFKS